MHWLTLRGTAPWVRLVVAMIAVATLAAACTTSVRNDGKADSDVVDIATADDEAAASEAAEQADQLDDPAVTGDAPGESADSAGTAPDDEQADRDDEAAATGDSPVESANSADTDPDDEQTDDPAPAEPGETEAAASDDTSASAPDDEDELPGDDALADAPADSANAERGPAPNGRTAPLVAADPAGLAKQIIDAERGLADPAATTAELADWGHLHQVAIRKLGYEPDWDIGVFAALPPDLVDRTLLHVSARRALIDLHSGYDAADFIPAWGIVEPATFDALGEHYRAAEAATGIEWEYLAAINLIETGMGRIRGLSSAGAQGPMQFLPTTWDEPGIGEGDINDPGDAIAAAARYLVRRGGPSDMDGALWGYNNSDNYVTAVNAYAEILRADPAAHRAIHHWEIYFYTEAGDVWLPVGFRSDESIDLTDFLAANPWSAPDPGLR